MLAQQKLVAFGKCRGKGGLGAHHRCNTRKEHHRIFFDRREHLQERFVQRFAIFRSRGLRQILGNHHGTAFVHVGLFCVNADERLLDAERIHAHLLQIVREVGLYRKRCRGKRCGLDPRIELFFPDATGMERERMQFDGMRVERFFHVEHPIRTAGLRNKFKVRDKAGDIGHAPFQIIEHTLDRIDVSGIGTELFGNRAGA